jgi:hypothetical protein
VNNLTGRAVRDSTNWPLVLPWISRAYEIDAVSPRGFATQHGGMEEMPVSVAQEICRAAKRYPLWLIEMADARLTKDVGSKAKLVGTSAIKDGWLSS